MGLLKHFNSLEELTAEMKAITASINKKLGIKPKKKKKLKIVKWLPNSAELVFSNPDLREIIFKKKVELIQTKITLRKNIVHLGEVLYKDKPFEIITNNPELKEQYEDMEINRFGQNEKLSKKFDVFIVDYKPKSEKHLIDNYFFRPLWNEINPDNIMIYPCRGLVYFPMGLDTAIMKEDFDRNDMDYYGGDTDMVDDWFNYYD